MYPGRRNFIQLSALAALYHSMGYTFAKAQEASPTLRELAKKNGRLYGSAIRSDQMNDKRYTDFIAKHCNVVTPEWEMKWESLSPQPGQRNFGALDQIMNFASDNKLKVRGHTLFWDTSHPKGASFPPSLDEFRKLHNDVMNRYRDKNVIYCWDVANEILVDKGTNANDTTDDAAWGLLKGLKPELIRDVFNIVHETDPKLELYINDLNIEYPGEKQDKYLKIGEYLKKNTKKITGMGIQSHLTFSDNNKFNFDGFEKFLKRINAIGLKPVITELDIIMYPPFPSSLQEIDNRIGDVYKQYCEIATRNGVDTIVTWGITDKFSYIYGFTGQQREQTRPHPFDSNFNPKPASNGIASALKLPNTRKKKAVRKTATK